MDAGLETWLEDCSGYSQGGLDTRIRFLVLYSLKPRFGTA